jgi:hypothetical protein
MSAIPTVHANIVYGLDVGSAVRCLTFHFMVGGIPVFASHIRVVGLDTLDRILAVVSADYVVDFFPETHDLLKKDFSGRGTDGIPSWLWACGLVDLNGAHVPVSH